MNSVIACILLACFMPYALAGMAKFGGARVTRTHYDNHMPRAWLGRLDGWPARANWAQQNSWEALPVFLAGVLLARQAGADTALIELWSVIWVTARVAYCVLYICDLAMLRSVVWSVATLAAFRLILAAW